MKDIAVVLPVFNGADLLESCIESICAAGNRISEIIIVDDGSTDETLDTARKLAEKESSIKVIHTDNHGTYMARVTGMKASTTSYVTSIDADDRYCKGCLDLLANLLEENDADAAMGSLVEIERLDQEIPQVPNPVVKVSDSEQVWPRIMKWKTQEFICYNNKLYKRELISNLLDADGICQGEDVLITCQAFLGVRKMVETTAPMYLYYLNPDSLTHVGFGRHDLDVIRVWDKVVSVMKKNRPDLLPMAQFNRWRTDFTLITRLILADNKELDKEYAGELKVWRKGLSAHWKDLIAPHAMPRNRELLIISLRFCFALTKTAMRLGRKLVKKETSVLLHSGDKR